MDKSVAEIRRLGCMIPKRHARRAVTRNLLRRQIRSAVRRHEVRLGPGDWLVRVTQGWPVSTWPSAASADLSAVVRAELNTLLARLSPQLALR